MALAGQGSPGIEPPLVVHLVFRFATGGLENGVVNLINHMPRGAFRHAVVAITDVDAGFAKRIQVNDVPCIALHKPPGHGLKAYRGLREALQRLRPDVVHSRNLAALEMQPAVAWCGVRARVHGEHGRDVEDPDGSSRKHQWIRRVYSPFVGHYIALSRELRAYLEDRVGINPSRISQIYNGVDALRFAPPAGARPRPAGCPFGSEHWVIGTVGRMLSVKAQPVLARAFVRALSLQPALRSRLRLAMIGDGPLRSEASAVLEAAGVADLAWLPGERSDVPDVMRGLDCFVLPSLAEGISNTILEAMASALPVLATGVGGNPELVVQGRTGEIVAAGDVEALALGIVAMAADPVQARAMGRAGRLEVERRFSLQAMVNAYMDVYRRLLARKA